MLPFQKVESESYLKERIELFLNARCLIATQSLKITVNMMDGS